VSTPNASSTAGRPPRSKPRRRWLRRLLLLILVLVAGAATAAGLWPTTRWAEAKGYVNAIHQSEIYPSCEGAIAEKPVPSGTQVVKNQLLIQLQDNIQQAARDEAIARLDAAKAELAALHSRQALEEKKRQEEIKRARTRLKSLKQKLQTMREAASGSFSHQEKQETEDEVDMAQSKLTQLQFSREQVQQDEIERLRKAIEAQKKAVERAEAELEARKVRAPHEGLVRFHRFEIGEVVKPKDALGQVFDRSGWVVKLDVPERYLAHVHEGQRVQVELASYPSWRHGYLEATVTRVMPVITPRPTGEGIFQVVADLEDPSDERLQAGVGVTARIETGQTTWLKRILGWN